MAKADLFVKQLKGSSSWQIWKSRSEATFVIRGEEKKNKGLITFLFPNTQGTRNSVK